MDIIHISGGRRLSGKLRIGGAKNAVLPVLAASLLCGDKVVLTDAPALGDTENMLGIMRHLGCAVRRYDDCLVIDGTRASGYCVSDDTAHEIRSSIFLLGPILARFGRAVFAYPGGCDIGRRPIDLHLKGLRALGADIEESGGLIHCRAERLYGAEIHLDYPSVGATENIMMAALLAKGETIIYNAAREPEIEALQDFCVLAGADVRGAGTGEIHILPAARMRGCEYAVMPDRIAAGTVLLAVAAAGGDVELENVRPEHISSLTDAMMRAGCRFEMRHNGLRITAPERLLPFGSIDTRPYPGFPTDLQAPLMAAAVFADGDTVITENIFENRFRHADELIKMGASIEISGRRAVIHGGKRLQGAAVHAADLRAGAAMVIAGLAAEGETFVSGVERIDRGYYGIEEMFGALGADISRRRG